MQQTQTESGTIDTRHKRLWLYAVIAVGISVAAVVLISLFTMDRNTLKAVSHVEAFSLVMVCVLVVGRWACECVRYTLIIRAIGRRLSFARTSKSILGAAFAGAVTPYRSASLPTQVFFLNRYGLTGGEATAVSLTGGAVSLLVMTVSLPVVLVLSLSQIHVSMTMSTIIVVVAVLAFFAFLVAVYSVKDPARFSRVLARMTPGFVKRKPGYARFEEKVTRGMADFSASLRRVTRAPKMLLVAIVALTVVFWLGGAFIASWLLRGFGFPQFFWKALLGQMLVSSILPFNPVPGDSGVAEFAFAGVFSIFIAKNTLAFITLAWRFFMLYVPLVGLGIFFVLAANDARRLGPRQERNVTAPSAEEPAPDGDAI
jgi:uncharacterized protein (TIRG00374 family)